jgi:hypothetical protein
MTANSSRRARLVPPLLALSIFTLLANCIDSAQPMLTDAQPLLGDRLRFQLYALREGAARDPIVATFVWRNGRYVLTSGTGEDFGDFTIHAFEGPDLIVQSIRPRLPTEYAIARKLADATYLIVPIDETDADEPTRHQFCGVEIGALCRVATRDAVTTFARSTAKPHTTGGLAVLLAD